MKLFQLLFLLCIAPPIIAQPNKELEELNKQYPDSTEILLKVGKSYLFSQSDSASKFFNKALAASDKENNLLAKANILKSIGILNMVKSQYDSAIYFYDLAADVYKKIHNNEGYADALTNKGFAYSKLARYTEALDFTHKGLDIYDSLNLPHKTSNTYTNLGIFFQLNGDFEKALINYQKAIDTAPDYKKNVKRSLVNIATIYNKQHKYDSALSIYKMAQIAMEEENDIFGLSIIHNNIGNVYYRLKQYAKAATQFRKAIGYKEQINNKQGQAIAYKNLAEVLLKLEKNKEAKLWANKSLELSKEVNSKKQILDALLLSAQIDKEMGNHSTANIFYANYITLKDSLDKAEQIKAIEEIEGKYETEKKDKQITKLELDKQKSTLILAEEKNQKNILFFVIGVVALISVFIFYLYNNKRKTSALLLEKNTQIANSLEERETLLKEIHHRVKNNLQIISSLLNLQAGSLDDKAAVDAVKEGQNRVKSMALIHQKLYSTDDIRGVNIQEYLENLTKDLFGAFGVDSDKVKYEIESNGLKLDIDTVIPLGLIINELITNTLKYAFEKSNDGLLEIKFKEEGNMLNVTVKDNGKGVDVDRVNSSTSFGWKMIRSLSRKLKAEIDIINNNGTTVKLTLSHYKLVI